MKLFSLLKKDLLILFRDRAEMAVLFLMPLAFILPISFALGKGDGYAINRANQMIPLPIVNYDDGPRAQELQTLLGESLRLEVAHDRALIASLGLGDDPDCDPAVIVNQEPAATETVEPEPSETETATQAAATQPAATEMPTSEPAATEPEPDLPTETAPAPAATSTEEAVETEEPTPDYPAQSSAPGRIGAYRKAAPASLKLEEKPLPQATEVQDGPQEAQDNVSSVSPICSDKIAQALLQRSWRSAALIIPPGFSENLDSGRRTWVTLLYDPTGDPIRREQIEGVVKGATIKISLQNQVESGLIQMADLAAFAPANVRQQVEAQAQAGPTANQQPAIRLEKVQPGSYSVRQTPDTYQQTIPGYTVMYVFFIITALTSSIRQERMNGTFRRLLSMPVGRLELLGSKLISAIIIGIAQVGLLFLIGALVFGLRLGRDLPALFALTVALVAAATALGLAAATTGAKGSALAALLVVAALVGGCMFPLDLMPPALRSISYFVPHSWALTGYQDLMVRGQGMASVMPEIGVLLAFAAVFFLIAIQRFNFKD